MLAEYREHGKAVLSVEYLTQPAAIAQYRQAALARGFIPYATVRALDELRPGLGRQD
jgi:endo-alpha-1,4-polygalactosaminidase (GH114 family)